MMMSMTLRSKVILRISQLIFEMWIASEACLLKGSEYEANICIWFSIMFCVLMVVHERLII